MTTVAERVERKTAPVPDLRRAPSRWQTYVPEALTGLAVLFNLWVLRDERLVVSYPNDSQTHLQMVQVAERLLSHGLLPFDHWYPHLSLGSPFFVQYQSASAVLAGAIGLVVGAQQAFAWTLYLLLALWPICIYVTGRLLGWGRWESGVAALLSPLLFSVTGRGFEHQAYDWLGSGLWSELWAMWTLPLALGFAWRYLNQRRYLFGAVFFFAATIAFHFLMAYLAGLLLVIMVFCSPRDLWRRLGRAVLVGGLALLATLWVTLPLLADARWTALNEFQVHTWIDDSFGAPTILRWLIHGQIYDNGRFPIVTILVGVGLLACCLQFLEDARARFLVIGWVVSLLLYFGRPTLGFLLDRLPGSKDLLFQRFIAGVHLTGIFLAAVGVVALARWSLALARRWAPDDVAHASGLPWVPVTLAVGAAVVLLAVLTPAWSEVRTYDDNNSWWIHYQRQVDANQGAQLSALLSLATARGGGRIYAGMPPSYNFGSKFFEGSTTQQSGVQVYIYMEGTDADAVGFTLRGFGLMTDPEVWFNQYVPGDYDALGIRYLVLPKGMSPPVPARLLTSSGQYTLWTVPSSGLVQVVDTRGSITANADDLGHQTKGFLSSSAPERAIYPTIAYDGQPAAPPTLVPGERAVGPAGRVLAVNDQLTVGSLSTTVNADRTSVVLLKASYDPGWTATVDGVAVTPEMVAPALVGVTVAPGVHHVVFVYRGYGSYPTLFVVGLLTLVGAAVGPWAWRRSERRRRALYASLRATRT
jgi:hypothetical protein